MEPASQTPSNFELPAPRNTQQGVRMPSAEQGPGGASLEQAVPRDELPGSPQGIPSSPPPLPQQLPADPIPVQQDVSTPSPVVPHPQSASDTELIEKEWVEKAKEIVEKTRSDPYAQNKEMSKIKADYLKLRFNKDLKVTE